MNSMKWNRYVSIILVIGLVIALFTGCGNQSKTEDQTLTEPKSTTTTTTTTTTEESKTSQPVKITFMNTKGEIQAQLEEVAKTFTDDNPDITLEIHPVAAGKSPFEAISTLYNSGNAPTLSMVDSGDIPRLKDNFLPLNNEKWMSDAIDGTTKVSTIDGTTYAFPFTIEGFGLIYNKNVLDKAYGGNFDPATITTRKALKEAFDKVEASGAKALIVSPMDWSLGAHMFSVNYIVEGKGDQTAYDKFFADLKEGSMDLAKNTAFNNWLDTFDILKSYNSAKNDPLSVTYEKGPEVLGKGEVGFWYMGNWAWPQIEQFDSANKQYGYIPYPMSDNPSDFGNDKIVAFPSKFVAIDKVQNKPEQQEAGKKFMNWLVYEKNGQDAIVNKMNLVPAFKNITLPIADPLGQSIVTHMAENKVMSAIDAFTVMPADHWSGVGASLQKYLSNNTDKAGLAKEIQEYWKSAK